MYLRVLYCKCYFCYIIINTENAISRSKQKKWTTNEGRQIFFSFQHILHGKLKKVWTKYIFVHAYHHSQKGANCEISL